GERAVVAPGVSVYAVASAHEELRTDTEGNHHFLGYVIETDAGVLYHSGDCAPYPGLVAALKGRGIDLALVPVNGRDEHRRSHGILGNFTFSEAVDLCLDAGIPSMITCHFGMFDFNTVDESTLDREIAEASGSLQCARPAPGRVYELITEAGSMPHGPELTKGTPR
ncbi:MAG: MBL fold metallo-hydrolase, partial [Planctomycetota bacterium]